MRIGIPTALYENYFGIHKYYIHWVSQFGDPVLLTPYQFQGDLFDALFLPGGSDVASADTFLTERSNPHLEWFDKTYIEYCSFEKKPLFGVCRGMQAINIKFGGTLRNLYAGDLDIHQHNKDEEDKNKLVHSVKVINKKYKEENSIFNEFAVNSIHHQVIDTLAPGMKVIAESNDDAKVVEAIVYEKAPIIGVQWHPEKINDKLSVKLFKSIL